MKAPKSPTKIVLHNARPLKDLYDMLTIALEHVDPTESVEDSGIGHYEYGSISAYDSNWGGYAELDNNKFSIVCEVIELPTEEEMEFFNSSDISDISESRDISRVVRTRYSDDGGDYDETEVVGNYSLFVKSLDSIRSEPCNGHYKVFVEITVDISE